MSRREALWQVQAYAAAAHGGELPGLAAELEEPVALPPADALVQAHMDFAATGLSTRWRGLEFLRTRLAEAGVLRAADLPELAASRPRPQGGQVSIPAAVRGLLGRSEVVREASTRRPSPQPSPTGRGSKSSRSLADEGRCAEISGGVAGSDGGRLPRQIAGGRYGERARRAGNHYDGRGSGRQFQGLGDSGVPDVLREQARTGIMVTVAGIVINRQHPPTARGYTFLSLEDETGLVNVIIRPDVFSRYQRAILDSPVMMVEGELQDEHGAVQVMAETCRPVTSDCLGTPPSRDWQ